MFTINYLALLQHTGRRSCESNLWQVDFDSFVMWILVVISVLSIVSNDTLYELVLSQIASLVGYADNNSLTNSVNQK